ncbi:hypothetical protein LY78DRAFT_56454 [Colletotrichum sublineola]|nr:hypothetical protein LY78DRAFT_56454 [Colletotrichum sublineola]
METGQGCRPLRRAPRFAGSAQWVLSLWASVAMRLTHLTTSYADRRQLPQCTYPRGRWKWIPYCIRKKMEYCGDCKRQ